MKSPTSLPLTAFPKMNLAKYFASGCYVKWAHNISMYTHQTGQAGDFEYGATVREQITF
jgi:hypothetical protein